MQSKYDITSRQRKVDKQTKKRETSYITTKNLNESAAIKWHKNNNVKKGGKSRHIVKF
tara:strand:- start:1103 stop:1276 length:174 start_codon:yes stop_codon:yes gene_type:complete